MIRKASRISAYSLAVIAVVMALIAGGATWRLSRGPVSLKFATPVMHKALNGMGLGVDIGFADTILTWDRQAHTLGVRATNVTVTEPGGGPAVGSVPQASVTLSLPALIRGHIAPTEIRLIRPALSALRRKDGKIVLVEGLGGGNGDAARFFNLLLTALRKPQSQDTSNLRFLKRVEVADANLSLHDAGTQSDWAMPGGSLTIIRQEDGLDAALDGMVESGDLKAQIGAKGHYNVATDQVTGSVDVEKLNIAALPKGLMPSPLLAGLDMDTALTLNYSFKPEAPVNLDFELAGLDGTLKVPGALPAPVAIDRLGIKGSFAGKDRKLTIDKIEAVSGEADLKVDGVVTLPQPGEEAGPSLTLFASADKMSVAQLKRFWPTGVKPKTRHWIEEHLLAGEFHGVSVSLDLDNLGEKGIKRPPDALQLRFRFDGLQATYIKTLPPIEEAKGYAELNLSDLKVHVDSGKTLALGLKDASIHINNLSVHGDQHADIELIVDGEVAEVLRLIDYPPLQYPTKFGMKPESVEGTSSTRVRFQFPLVDDLGLDQVNFAAAATLKDVALPNLFAKTKTDNGRLLLTVNPQGLTAEGTLSFNDVPFTVSWHERFAKGEGPPSHYTLKADLDDAAWEKLKLPFNPRITGTAPISLSLSGKGKEISDGVGHLDLTGTKLDVAEFGWEKKPEVKAGVDFKFRTRDDGLEVTAYQLLAPDFAANGIISLKPDFSLKHALVNMTIGISDLTMDVYGQPDNGYEIFAEGGTVDLRPLLSFATSEKKNESEPFASLNFGGHFDKALLYNDVALGDMAVKANFIQGWWEGGYLLSDLGKNGDLSFSLERDGPNRMISLSSSDAGQLLHGLGYYASGEGGHLNINAVIDDSREGSPVVGQASITNIVVKNAPVMAKLLTLASFTGIADTLGGGGIHFDRVKVPFTLNKGVLNISDGGAFGPAVGLTVEGQVDRAAGTLNLGGSIIPSYTLNSFLGKIPLIGPIFSGKQGGGLIGFTYRVTGSAEDPSVAVNPLAALAPGFLRGIFSDIDHAPSGEAKPQEQGTSAPVE